MLTLFHFVASGMDAAHRFGLNIFSFSGVVFLRLCSFVPIVVHTAAQPAGRCCLFVPVVFHTAAQPVGRCCLFCLFVCFVLCVHDDLWVETALSCRFHPKVACCFFTKEQAPRREVVVVVLDEVCF